MKSILYIGASLMIGACVYGFVDYKSAHGKEALQSLYSNKSVASASSPADEQVAATKTTDKVDEQSKQVEEKSVNINEKSLTVGENAMRVHEKSMQVNAKTMQVNAKPLPNEASTRSTTVQTEKQPAAVKKPTATKRKNTRHKKLSLKKYSRAAMVEDVELRLHKIPEPH